MSDLAQEGDIERRLKALLDLVVAALKEHPGKWEQATRTEWFIGALLADMGLGE